jgi:hypothetical protein
MHSNVFAKAATGAELQRQLLLRQQIALLQQLAAMVQHLCERIAWESLTLPERRAMQRELASLKKTAQAARQRLKDGHARSRS